MKLTLQYGKTGLPLALPDDWPVTVIRKQPMPLLADPQAAVLEAFRQPVAAPSLTDAARGCKKACIVICDVTRPVPNHLFLQPVIRELFRAGLKPEAITVLVATGLHRPNLGEELLAVVGDEWVLQNVRVENHYAKDDAAHVHLGTTSNGVPVKIDRRFVEADFRLATGLVEPHLMAGYSGGRKLIAPGIAYADTIRTLHAARLLEDPRSAPAILDGNPVHVAQLEILQMVGGCLALNTVIDEERRLAFVNYGECRASHLAAVAWARDYSEVAVPRRFRTVITSSAGYPLDKTFYQINKGMIGALDILEPGGRLFLAAECSEGLGSKEFAESQERLVQQGPENFTAGIQRKRLADIDEWGTEMEVKALRRCSIVLYASGLTPAQQGLTGLPVVTDLDQAVRQWVAEIGDPNVAVIPEGPYVVPVFRA